MLSVDCQGKCSWDPLLQPTSSEHLKSEEMNRRRRREIKSMRGGSRRYAEDRIRTHIYREAKHIPEEPGILGMKLFNRKLTTSLAVWPASTCGSICGRLQLLDVLVYLEERKCA